MWEATLYILNLGNALVVIIKSFLLQSYTVVVPSVIKFTNNDTKRIAIFSGKEVYFILNTPKRGIVSDKIPNRPSKV